MELKHTPGPWKITETQTHITVIGADNQTIFHDDKRCSLVVEDAFLIAAAPEMLEALIAIRESDVDGLAHIDIDVLISNAIGAGK